MSCDLIRHDLIKSFSLPYLIKDFPDEKILNAKATSSAHFFFRWDERLYLDLYFDFLFLDLRNDRQSDDLHGKQGENEFPWGCSDIFCIHNISPTKRIANQSLLLTAILSRQATRNSDACQDKTVAWETNSLHRSQLLCRHESCLPTNNWNQRSAAWQNKELLHKTNMPTW